MKSTSLALLEERIDAVAQDVAARTQKIIAEVMPAAEVIVAEVGAAAKDGELDELIALLDQVATLDQGRSGVGKCIDAAEAKYGGFMPTQEKAVVDQALASWEASDGPRLLAELAQSLRTMRAAGPPQQ